MLDEIGFSCDIWQHRRDEAWLKQYDQLKAYKKSHGDCNVPRFYAKDQTLATWVVSQRRAYKSMVDGKATRMAEERVTKLNEIGFLLILNFS